MCKRESSAKFDTAYRTQPYSADSNGQFAPFVVLDCRGLEFIGFEARVSQLFTELAGSLEVDLRI
jgi:hypothetical protein